MATREYTLPVGNDLIDAAGNGWQIAGITIDNPSGSWLHVGGAVNAYVPPYTLGWTAPVSPTQWNVTVRFTDSPSGSVSDLVGDPVTVRLHDYAVPSFAGNPSGSGSKQSSIPPSLHAIAPSIGTGASSTLISMLTEPNRRIVVRRLEIVPDLTAGMATMEPFRSLITVRFQPAGGGSGTPEWYLSISPESPFAEASFEDGTFVLGAGENLEITGFAENGSAKAFYIAMAQYYLENA